MVEYEQSMVGLHCQRNLMEFEVLAFSDRLAPLFC